MKLDLIIRDLNENGDSILYIMDERLNPIEAHLFSSDEKDKITETTTLLRSKYNLRFINWHNFRVVNLGFLVNGKRRYRHLNKYRG